LPCRGAFDTSRIGGGHVVENRFRAKLKGALEQSLHGDPRWTALLQKMIDVVEIERCVRRSQPKLIVVEVALEIVRRS
jgi:hypothetical protein